MADHAHANTTASTSAKAASSGPAAKPKDATMSNAEHSTFVDLLLQQAAAAARDARLQVEPKALAQGVGRAVSHTRQALDEYSMPGTGTTPTRMFASLDAVFMGLFDLHAVVLNAEGDASPHADDLREVMRQLKQRFEPLGWKTPASAAAGHAREKKAVSAGAAEITTGEKGKLGLLHIRAARQHIVGGWQNVIENNVSGVADPAAENLQDAMSLLVDPSVAGEMKSAATELEMTNAVLNRLFFYVSSNNAAALPSLRYLAKSADALLELIGMPAMWTSKLAPTSQAAAQPASAPTGAAKATQSSTSPTYAPIANNEANPGAPRAEPAMHRTVETRIWSEKVHLKDTYLEDEYLGYIELFMEVTKTPSGQVYVQVHRANKHLLGRANEQLMMSADVATFFET